MKPSAFKSTISKTLLITVGIVVLLLLSVLFLWMGSRNSIQSETSIVAGVSFQGEYKIADGPYRPIVAGEHVSSTQGDVTLRGFFQLHNPIDNSPIGTVPAGETVNVYLNHLGGYAILPEGYKIPFESENKNYGEDSCAVSWGTLPATGEEPIVIVLHNPHRYGNENAVDDFFENISIVPGIYHESMMLEKGESQRNAGLLIFMMSLIFLGIATFSTFIHIKRSREMWLIGMMSLFASGYLFFDAFAVSIWNDSNIINTRMLGLCMMFYMLFSTTMIAIMLKGKPKMIAQIATALSGVTVACCVLVSLFSGIYFYDTWLWWGAIECAAVLTLIVCLILSFRGAPLIKRYSYAISIVLLTAFLLDFVGTGVGWWAGGFLSKFVFYGVFAIALVAVLRIIPANINASFRARELEAQQQALQLELQESRISIMLSQMQPHFIFNTLNTIYHLCEIDPEKARSTISAFSEYLRNNIDNLEQSEMISFEKEFSFVKTYLDIEKVRFDDELTVVLDIGVTNFKLPVLTVEPIVENAVKHGTSKKEGASTLFISTRETPTHYEIEVRDTGVGFDTSNYVSDGHKHVGISNVKQRLANLCGGTLTIKSVRGEGTTATIRIPKKETPRI